MNVCDMCQGSSLALLSVGELEVSYSSMTFRCAITDKSILHTPSIIWEKRRGSWFLFCFRSHIFHAPDLNIYCLYTIFLPDNSIGVLPWKSERDCSLPCSLTDESTDMKLYFPFHRGRVQYTTRISGWYVFLLFARPTDFVAHPENIGGRIR